MANPSIFAAFERMWQHVVVALSGKSDSNHTHDDRYYTETEVDTKISNHTGDSDVHVTTTNKTQWNSAYTHSTSAHAPSTAEKNIIVGIQRNGTDLTVNSTTRKVNITVPTQASDIGASPENHGHDAATTSKDGFMTSAMVTKLSGIATGAQVNTITGVKGNSESLYRTGNVNITKANIGLGNVDNTSDANKPVSTAQQAAIDSSLSSAKSYTDGKIDALVGEGASTTLDTIGEISAAITENQGMLTTLNNAIGNKVDKVSGKGLSTNDLTATLKSNYDTAYSHVSNKSNPHGVTLSQLGVSATADELNYVDGVTSNIQTQLDAKSDSDHTHNYAGSSTAGGAATSANKVNSSLTVKLNSGTTEGTNMFTFNGSGAKSINITPSAIGASASGHNHDDRYYTETEIDTKLSGKASTSVATQSANGLMSSTDKTKLDGIASGANAYTHPTTSGNKHIPSGGSSGQILRWSADGTAAWGADNNTTYGVVSTTADGLAPKRDGSTTKFLRADGTWAVPPDNNTVYTHPANHPASMITGLATVATSGSYNDLSNKPSIPQLNDSTSSTSTTTAATANAVQLAYSKAVTATATANSALDTANGKSTVTESSTNGKVTVNGTDIKVYEHPTTAGNKHIPTGGSNGQVLKWGGTGIATWGTDKDTTYSLSSGDNNGTIKVTPSSGSAYNVAVKGLGSVAYQSTVPIENGGTGATTAADAIANLGAMDLTSDQTASGLKTFADGIEIGNALFSYDSENKRIVISIQ